MFNIKLSHLFYPNMKLEAVSMLDIAKHTNDVARDQYGEAMASSVRYKTQFFLPMIERFLPPSEFDQSRICKILDLGSCTSSLAVDLAANLPDNYHFIETDLDMNFLRKGRDKVLQNTDFARRFAHIRANVVEMPLASESMDAVMHSSFFHEIFSFPVTEAGAFSKENCYQLIREIRRVLKPGGYVLGRDYVGRPDNPDELMLLEADCTNGEVIDDLKALMEAPVETLSSYSLVKRFLYQFEPAQTGPIVVKEDNKFTLPAWLAGELLFHSSYRESNSMWNSEIHEMYGDSSADDLAQMAEQFGFDSVLTESISHYDIGVNSGMVLSNTAGQIIDIRARFPTNTYIVWQKI